MVNEAGTVTLLGQKFRVDPNLPWRVKISEIGAARTIKLDYTRRNIQIRKHVGMVNYCMLFRRSYFVRYSVL